MEESYTVKQALKNTGLSLYRLQKIIFQYNFTMINGRIRKKDLDPIIAECREYISLYEYAISRSTEYFNGRNSGCRKKLYDYLLINDFFGLKVKAPENLLSGIKQDMLFLPRNGVPVLDRNLSGYLSSFGISEEEKIDRMLQNSIGHETTIKYLKKYREVIIGVNPASKTTTEFFRLVLSIPDVTKTTNSVIEELLKKAAFVESRNHIVNYFNYVKDYEKVSYDRIVLINTENHNRVPAYSNDQYIALAICFFNRLHIKEHDMIRKALDNHVFAEMWLYLCLFFACGWRASNICKSWHYLELYKGKTNIDGINSDTLYQDILYQRIPDAVYIQACDIVLNRLKLSPESASKNLSRYPLSSVISPDLKAFYGMLILIGESHRLRSNNGYMQKNRTGTYQNKVKLQAFFGNNIREILHNQHIESTRLNKDYLQGIEEEGRKLGLAGIQTAMLAAYARNHNGLTSISHYLKDESLTQETAEFVLYSMLERGVFGFQKYQALITAFPEVMLSLPMAQQTQIMKMLDSTPLEIEIEHVGIVAQKKLLKAFKSGDEQESLSILKSMFTISQQRGKGKDTGIYCLRRARDEACIYPSYESCLVCCCEYLVFTKYGLIPLLKVLKDYNDQAASGNKKAESILNKILIPRYQKIINELIISANIPVNEQNSIKKLIQQILMTNS